MWPNKDITKEQLDEFRIYIANQLDAKIKVVADRKLNDWFENSVKGVVEHLVRNDDALSEKINEAVSKEFEKIVIVKLERK